LGIHVVKNFSITEAISVHLPLMNKQIRTRLDTHEQRVGQEAWHVIESFGAALVQERRAAEKSLRTSGEERETQLKTAAETL
jgi:hypothetical protein